MREEKKTQTEELKANPKAHSLTHSLKLQTVTNSNMTNEVRKGDTLLLIMIKHHNLKFSQDRGERLAWSVTTDDSGGTEVGSCL